jgi:nucleoside-diphosphate-sugar epimerase
MRVCIVGASGKLGQCMVQHALDRGYEVVGVCREESIEKLDAFKERITVVPGATNDREIIKRDGVLVVLVPRGVHGYSTGRAQADFALLMVEALENDELIHEAPAIVDRQTPPALAHAATE